MYFHAGTLRKAMALAHRPENASCRHLFFAYTLTSLFLLLRAFVWVGRKLDTVFFPGYRAQGVARLYHPHALLQADGSLGRNSKYG